MYVKKIETVYPEIWGILKLSGLINQKIFETVYRNFQTVSKACALILLWTGKKETIVPDGEYICLSLRNACLTLSGAGVWRLNLGRGQGGEKHPPLYINISSAIGPKMIPSLISRRE